MFSTASGFSIFAIIGILYLEFSLIRSCSFIKSSGVLTKESAIQSTSFQWQIGIFISFSVNAGREIFVFGRFTPFLDFNFHL